MLTRAGGATARPIRVARVIARLNIGGPAQHAILLDGRSGPDPVRHHARHGRGGPRRRGFFTDAARARGVDSGGDSRTRPGDSPGAGPDGADQARPALPSAAAGHRAHPHGEGRNAGPAGRPARPGSGEDPYLSRPRAGGLLLAAGHPGLSGDRTAARPHDGPTGDGESSTESATPGHGDRSAGASGGGATRPGSGAIPTGPPGVADAPSVAGSDRATRRSSASWDAWCRSRTMPRSSRRWRVSMPRVRRCTSSSSGMGRSAPGWRGLRAASGLASDPFLGMARRSGDYPGGTGRGNLCLQKRGNAGGAHRGHGRGDPRTVHRRGGRGGPRDPRATGWLVPSGRPGRHGERDPAPADDGPSAGVSRRRDGMVALDRHDVARLISRVEVLYADVLAKKQSQ